MDKRSGHGIQDARHGQHDSCEVQAHGKRQIIADGLHHMLGEGKEMRQFLNFIIDKDNIGRIDGDVTANTAHRDADARSLEGKGIVDATDRQRRFFHLPYGRKLCLGQTGGFDVPYANLLCHRMRGGLVVARQQHRFNTKSLQAANRRRGFPVTKYVKTAATTAPMTIHTAQRSPRETIFALPASADCTRRIIR